MFAATNMLVCVLLLLHFCSELLFPLCLGRSGRLRSCRGRGLWHQKGDCGGSVGHLGELWVMVWRPDSHGVGKIFLGQGMPFCGPSAGANCCMRNRQTGSVGYAGMRATTRAHRSPRPRGQAAKGARVARSRSEVMTIRRTGSVTLALGAPTW